MNQERSGCLERAPSDMLMDLHVYLMPSDHWREHLHSAVNQIIGATMSAGFIRIHPEMLLFDLRREVAKQIGFEIIPKKFVFLRCIGRCFTEVRAKQEKTLKAKHFLPPIAYVPEIFVLDAAAANRCFENDEDDQEQQRLTELLRQQREEKEEEEGQRRLLDEKHEKEMAARIPTPPLQSDEESNQLKQELERQKTWKMEMEKQKEKLTKHIKALEAKQHNRKKQSRDLWKKKYFDEKKKTMPIEEECSKLRQDLEQEHRKIVAQAESTKESHKRSIGEKNLQHLNLNILATRHEHDLEKLQTRLQNVKMRLTVEMKLRYRSYVDLQSLETELAQLNVNLTMKRS